MSSKIAPPQGAAMDLLHIYLLRIVKVAVRPSLSIAEGILFALVIAAWLLPQFMTGVDPSDGQVVASVLVTVVAVRLLMAPYWIWKEERERADKLAEHGKNDRIRGERRERLQRFYKAGLDLERRRLPKDTSTAADVDAWVEEVDTWANDIARWLESNVSEGARARFIDLTGMMAMSWSLALNEKHERSHNSLTRLLKNLLSIIEGDAWL
jgi:hypothetical protein